MSLVFEKHLDDDRWVLVAAFSTEQAANKFVDSFIDENDQKIVEHKIVKIMEQPTAPT